MKQFFIWSECKTIPVQFFLNCNNFGIKIEYVSMYEEITELMYFMDRGYCTFQFIFAFSVFTLVENL